MTTEARCYPAGLKTGRGQKPRNAAIDAGKGRHRFPLPLLERAQAYGHRDCSPVRLL